MVVYKLDRMARSLKHLLELTHDLNERGIHFRSINEQINTSTSTGRFFFSIMGALAEMERELIVERTREGLKAARVRGRLGGRPRKLTEQKMDSVRELVQSGRSVSEVAQLLGVDRSTVYRRLKG